MRMLRAFSVSAFLIPVAGLVAFGANSGRSHSVSARKAPVKVVSNAVKTASSAPTLISFHEVVEPYLRANCASCHSGDKHTSGFNVENVESLFKGGAKNGAKVILPGNARDSVMVAYLRGTKQPRMPFGGQAVPEQTIKQIETWINQGAKIDPIKLGWPYTKPVSASIPKVKNKAWIRNPIDNFVLAKLESKGLQPAPPATKVQLLRRVFADVIGEPPTPQEAAQFLTDNSPTAYENLVDRLLADPRYGERWGRHWLDLVRYADSDGFENDGVRPRAWRFRDYVIRSFNADKPYDRFLKEQIAGDELFPNDSDAIIATAYARLGPWDSLSTDPPQRWQDYLNDVTDTTGSVMLGLTVGCARCHNHKYDRISQADYYRLQAFFVQTRWTDTNLPDAKTEPASFTKTIDECEAHLKTLRQQREELRDKYRAQVKVEKQQSAQPGDKIKVDEGDINRAIEKVQADHRLRDQIDSDIRYWEEKEAPVRPVAEALTDGGKTAPKEYLLKRGNLLTPGQEVQPGFVASLVGGEEKPADIAPANGNTTGRRAALANWIAGKDNPMTARVMVNRIWQHHFGRGIVGTPSDFGKNGDKATHPELLEWLANRFLEDGWSLKKTHRLMLLSNTYQMSSKMNPVAFKIDPTNNLFWRMNRIRLEGEALRDSILTVSGRLNPAQYGPGVFPHVSDEVLSTGSTHKWGNSSDEEGRRRTVYVFQRRSLVLPIVEAFDGADMTNTCPRRSTTTIAPQALALFNGEFSQTEAQFFAKRVMTEAGEDQNKQIEQAYLIALIRRPTAAQKALALSFLSKQTQLHLQADKESGPDAQKKAAFAALSDFCHVLINTNEFIYLD